MSIDTGTTTGPTTAGGVTCTTTGFLGVPSGRPQPVAVELEGGRRRWSVGGRMAEGPRWWRGEVTWESADEVLDVGTLVRLTLADGRTGDAVVEGRAGQLGAVLRGISPPPFAVP